MSGGTKAAKAVLSVLTLSLMTLGAFASQSPKSDPIAEKLEKAKEGYRAKEAKIRAPVLKNLERAEVKALKDGKLERLQQIRDERDVLEATEDAPTVVESKEYRRLLNRAREDLARAYEEAIKAYTNANEIDAARQLKRDHEEFLSATDSTLERKDIDALIKFASDNFGFFDYLQQQMNAATARFDRRDGVTIVSEIAGRKNLLCTHPLGLKQPATIDFGNVTTRGSGTLILFAHGFFGPGRGGRLIVKIDDKVFSDAVIEAADGWQRVAIPFSSSRVVVEHHAVDWNCEVLFLDYSFKRSSAVRAAIAAARPAK